MNSTMNTKQMRSNGSTNSLTWKMKGAKNSRIGNKRFQGGYNEGHRNTQKKQIGESNGAWRTALQKHEDFVEKEEKSTLTPYQFETDLQAYETHQPEEKSTLIAHQTDTEFNVYETH